MAQKDTELVAAIIVAIITAVINIGYLYWNMRQTFIQHRKTEELTRLTSELQNKVNRLSVDLDQSLRRLHRARELLANLFELKASYPSDPSIGVRMIGYWAELSATAIYLQGKYGDLGKDFKNKKDAIGSVMVSGQTFAVYDAAANKNTPEFDMVMDLFELIEKMIDLELHSPNPPLEGSKSD